MLHVVLQDFSFENSTASIRAYASYSDGFANDVTDLPGLNITSLAAAYLTVNDTVGNITVMPITQHFCFCVPSARYLDCKNVALSGEQGCLLSNAAWY